MIMYWLEWRCRENATVTQSSLEAVRSYAVLSVSSSKCRCQWTGLYSQLECPVMPRLELADCCGGTVECGGDRDGEQERKQSFAQRMFISAHATSFGE